MKNLFFTIFVFAVLVLGCDKVSHNISAHSTKSQVSIPPETSRADDTARFYDYRDTIVGNFSGTQIDTLTAEPMGFTYDDFFEMNFCDQWRVYSFNGSVKDVIVDGTISIHFVPEGDLDGDGRDEWGYITDWSTSNWMTYQVYTYDRQGNGQLLYNPLSIWLGHIKESPQDEGIDREDIVRKSKIRNTVNVKFSDVRNDGADFLIIDTVVPIIK